MTLRQEAARERAKQEGIQEKRGCELGKTGNSAVGECPPMIGPACTNTIRNGSDIILLDEALRRPENTPTSSTNAHEITIGFSGSGLVDLDSIKNMFCSFYRRTADDIHTQSHSAAKLRFGTARRAKGYYLMSTWTINELTPPGPRVIAPLRAHIWDVRPLPDKIGHCARHMSTAALCQKPVS